MTEFTLVIGNRNYSSWSLRAWLAARASGLAFAVELVPLGPPNRSVGLDTYSPSGRVPVLQEGDFRLWESLAIAEYLADRAPEAGLWPADMHERALARAVANEMHAGFGALRDGLPMDLRADRPCTVWCADVAADIRRIQQIWCECRARRPAGGPFLFGAFTIADAMYAPIVGRFRTYRVPVEGAARDYMEALWAWSGMVEWVGEARAEPWVIEDP